MSATANIASRTFVIASGVSLSAEIDIEGFDIVAIIMPATWTAANLTFQGATATGGTFQDLYDDSGTEIIVTAAAARVLALDPKRAEISALRFIKVRSGDTGTPVNQAAERTLTLILKR